MIGALGLNVKSGVCRQIIHVCNAVAHEVRNLDLLGRLDGVAEVEDDLGIAGNLRARARKLVGNGIALTDGAVSHFAIGGMPDMLVWVLCVLFTLLWARIAAVFANKATPKTLNRATGVVLVVLGVVIMGFNLLT